MDTSDRYRLFAEVEAAGTSPIYERLALAVASSPRLLGLLAELPTQKRQPNLLFAASRLSGAPLGNPAAFAGFVEESWSEISTTMLERSTQTNEASRTGTFLPVLAAIDGPVALVEVGCSAGLCLYPDRYRISFDERPPLCSDSPVAFGVTTTGPVAIPERLPDVVARIGIDLNPIAASDTDRCAWLEALIWPEHEVRLRRLQAALSVAEADPPILLRGDFIDRLGDALLLVPHGATAVVFHSAVLAYVAAADRRRFAELMNEHPDVVWISNEAPGVIEGVSTDLEPPASATTRSFFVTARPGVGVVGIADAHGSWIRW
ncbi:MAG: DUF2332 domain-containing protein [Acidimicrobiales bacterium]